MPRRACWCGWRWLREPRVCGGCGWVVTTPAGETVTVESFHRLGAGKEPGLRPGRPCRSEALAAGRLWRAAALTASKRSWKARTAPPPASACAPSSCCARAAPSASASTGFRSSPRARTSSRSTISPPPYPPRRCGRSLADARAANMNMIRIWGGGYYLDDAFYDAQMSWDARLAGLHVRRRGDAARCGLSGKRGERGRRAGRPAGQSCVDRPLGGQ